MLKFTSRPQQYPHLREAELRQEDFQEIYDSFRPEKAKEQAERCSQCGIPFCQVHCPLQNNIPDWLKLTAEGRIKEAYEVSAATNNFPEICGRICPQDRLCEGNCVIEKDFNSVTIGAVEKYLTDTAWNEGWVKPFPPKQESGFSVGIIGAGPAGLAAAEQLRRKGHEVHVYDRYDRVGGLMVYGIPNFKLDKSILAKRRAQFEASGIQFHLNVSIGEDITMEELRKKHDAVLVATGVYKARELRAPNATLAGIVPAMDYLTASNRKGLGDKVTAFDSGVLNAGGKNVIVIGGGDTAMDCVRTAIRQDAKSVTCLYRRDRENMPGSRREVKYAEEEGVVFRWMASPIGFQGTAQVESVLVQDMRLGPIDASGRRQPEPIEGAKTSMQADLVIMALGFDAEDLPVMFNAPQLKLTQYGTLKIGRDNMTSMNGVFAAGDIARGASLVVWAIRDGREAAEAMHDYMIAQKEKAA